MTRGWRCDALHIAPGTLLVVNKALKRMSVLDTVATVCLAAEVVTLIVLTVSYSTYAINTDGAQRFLWGAAAVCLLFALGLAFVTWGFYKGRRFALGAAFAWQLLQVAAVSWLLGSAPWIAGALLVMAVVVAAAVMKRVASLPRDRAVDS